MVDPLRPGAVERIVAQTVPVSEFRNGAAACLRTIRTIGPVRLTKHGRAVAVIVTPEEYESLWRAREALRRAGKQHA